MKQWHEKWILDASLDLYKHESQPGKMPKDRAFMEAVVTAFKLFQECCNGFDKMEKGEMGEVHGIYTEPEEKEDEERIPSRTD